MTFKLKLNCKKILIFCFLFLFSFSTYANSEKEIIFSGTGSNEKEAKMNLMESIYFQIAIIELEGNLNKDVKKIRKDSLDSQTKLSIKTIQNINDKVKISKEQISIFELQKFGGRYSSKKKGKYKVTAILTISKENLEKYVDFLTKRNLKIKININSENTIDEDIQKKLIQKLKNHLASFQLEYEINNGNNIKSNYNILSDNNAANRTSKVTTLNVNISIQKKRPEWLNKECLFCKLSFDVPQDHPLKDLFHLDILSRISDPSNLSYVVDRYFEKIKEKRKEINIKNFIFPDSFIKECREIFQHHICKISIYSLSDNKTAGSVENKRIKEIENLIFSLKPDFFSKSDNIPEPFSLMVGYKVKEDSFFFFSGEITIKLKNEFEGEEIYKVTFDDPQSGMRKVRFFLFVFSLLLIFGTTIYLRIKPKNIELKYEDEFKINGIRNYFSIQGNITLNSYSKIRKDFRRNKKIQEEIKEKIKSKLEKNQILLKDKDEFIKTIEKDLNIKFNNLEILFKNETLICPFCGEENDLNSPKCTKCSNILFGKST